jgi:hypothetical protein
LLDVNQPLRDAHHTQHPAKKLLIVASLTDQKTRKPEARILIWMSDH